MVNLQLKNIKEIDPSYHTEIKNICEEKHNYFNELFKKYSKNLTFEIIFDHSSAVYKVSASLDLKSKKILLVEEHKDILKALTSLLSKFKKAVKKQYELERKDYLYKRKR